jgi:hypothetical protein
LDGGTTWSTQQQSFAIGALEVTENGPQVTGVPEPGSLTLLGIGVLGLLGYGWRRRKQAVA